MSVITAIGAPLSHAEESFIERGRAAFAVRFPGQDYDAKSWSIRHLKKSGSGQGNVSLLYTRIAKGHQSEVLPSRFAAAIKACLAVGGKEPGSMYNCSTAARWLWEAMDRRLGGNHEAFSWAGFGKEDAERAEEIMIESGMKSNSIYRRCIDLQGLLATLAEAGVIAPVVPDFQTPRQDSADRLTLDGQEARAYLLPTEEAINALADIYNGQHELDPFDQLLSCVPALMFASGLRIIEPLQFTTNPIHKEGKRYFLSYFKAKGRHAIEEKIPLTSKQAALAQEAVRRAQDLTRDARVRAKELVDSPHQFPLPQWAIEREWLSVQDVTELLGTSSAAILKHVETKHDQVSNTKFFSRSSIQEHLQKQRGRFCLESIRGVTKRADGTWLPLDEALFICFKHAGHGSKGSSRLIVNLVRQQQIGTFLGGHGNGLESIFERLGLCEKDGRPICLNAHQIRHYVTSKASGAGVADPHLVRWQRREHEGDLAAYKHLTSEERLRRLREHVRSGRLKGDIATMYFALAQDERDIFLENVVQAVHVTHLGFCVHDFNTSPCPSAMNCVKRCGSYLFDTKDDGQRKRLIDLKLKNTRALEDAQTAEAAGNGLMVEEWVRELKETDEGLQIILAAESGVDSPLVAPFSDSPSKFRPFG